MTTRSVISNWCVNQLCTTYSNWLWRFIFRKSIVGVINFWAAMNKSGEWKVLASNRNYTYDYWWWLKWLYRMREDSWFIRWKACDGMCVGGSVLICKEYSARYQHAKKATTMNGSDTIRRDEGKCSKSSPYLFYSPPPSSLFQWRTFVIWSFTFFPCIQYMLW